MHCYGVIYPLSCPMDGNMNTHHVKEGRTCFDATFFSNYIPFIG